MRKERYCNSQKRRRPRVALGIVVGLIVSRPDTRNHLIRVIRGDKGGRFKGEAHESLDVYLLPVNGILYSDTGNPSTGAPGIWPLALLKPVGGGPDRGNAVNLSAAMSLIQARA